MVTKPKSTGDTSTAAAPDAELLPADERARVLSGGRLKLTLLAFMVMVLLALSGMIFSGVTRIFDWLTPTIERDLALKARHAAIELAETVQPGVAQSDRRLVEPVLEDYIADPDVVGLAVFGSDGRPLYTRGQLATLTTVFALPSGRTHELAHHFAAWMPSTLEEAPAGRVAVLISKARLNAGLHLRHQILLAATSGCLLALVLSIVFVNLYIGPILRVTSDAFVRLERTTEAALAAARSKSQFLANMSHEIRTPMNGIIGVLDLLNLTPLNAKQQRYTQTIESSARGLLTIINDVLDFSKLEAGKYELRTDDFEVNQLVQEVAELLSPKAHAKKLELIVRIAPDVPRALRGDADRIKQVLTNLTGNAIKFTEHGHVEVRVTREPSGRQVRFSVLDTGIGIRAADHAQLFEMFTQVDGSLTRKHGGTGLGLSISKHLAEAMGGAIGLASEHGRGATFWFTIPLHLSERRATLVPLPPRAATVLIVTPSDAQRDALCELIQRWEMRCLTADQPEHAILQLQTEAGTITAVAVDGVFDASDAACSRLFDVCAGEGVPVIRLLSTTQMADARSEQPLQSVLCKPVRASELYNTLIALIDGTAAAAPSSSSQVDLPAVSRSLRHRVLVVDDNEINRVVAVELLSELGYGSDVAINGVEAVERAKAGHYDAILMDCQMPELDGFGATAQIRQLPLPIARVPIIALTAHAMADDRGRMLRGGMDDYASKPIRARVLDRLLRRWIPDPSAAAQPRPPAMRGDETLDNIPIAAISGNRSPLSASAPVDAQAVTLPELDEGLTRSPRAVSLFLQLAPGHVEELTRAVAREDTSQVRQLAHKLKGSCLSLGVSRLAATCQVLELAASAGTIDHQASARLPGLLAAVIPRLEPLQERRASNDL
ncbi:MAG: ATP-binding protein [Polyangiales bacterium]